MPGLITFGVSLLLSGFLVWDSMQREGQKPAQWVLHEPASAPPPPNPRVWDAWNAVANVWRSAGAAVQQSNDPRKMVVILPVQMARKLTDYDLKAMTQAAWSRFPGAYSLRVRDEFGTELVSASVFGVKVTR